jgi:hypothetical protein
MSKETLVNKSETFEDWRLKSNEVSLDLGAVASDDTYSSTSLDTESRLTDQYITKNDLGDGAVYIRDISSIAGGLEIDHSADRMLDNTDGYIILKDGVENAASWAQFPPGTKLCQYANNTTGTTVIFSAIVVSCSNKKILIDNVGGTEPFNPTLRLYDSGNAGYTKFIPASYLKELIVESYNHGNVRVYLSRNYQFPASHQGGATTNTLTLSDDTYYAIQDGEKVTYTTPDPASNGILAGKSAGEVTTLYVKKSESYDNTEISLSLSPGGSDVTLLNGSETQTLTTSRVALKQGMVRNGFHIAPQSYYVTHTASSIPVTFLEGEVVYQGSDVNNPDFQATLYTADVAGTLIFKNILLGTFNSSVDLKSTTLTNGAGTALTAANTKIAAADLNNDFKTSNATISQMIEFNTPAAASDDYKVYFGSAVDAVLELQDDVGTVENLQTNNTTDLTVAINELELGIRGTSNNLVADDLGNSTGRPAFTADDIVSALVEHEVDLFGASKSLSDLGTNDKGDFVLSINELETAIRGTNTALVSADLVSTSSPSAHPAMTATNLIDAVLEHEVDLYGTGSQTLGSLATNNQSNFVAAINELETAIRGTNGGLVLTDLGVTLTSYSNSAVNLVDHNEELQRDIGDVTNTKLGLLNTSNVTLATHGSAIASGETVLTMVSNPIVAGIKVGMFVTSQHSPNSIDTSTGGGTFVTAVSTTQVTLSRATAGALTSAALIFKVEDIVTKIKDLDDVLGDIALINNDTFYTDIAFTDTTVKDSINSITDYIGGTDIGSVINSGSETLTNAIAQLYTDIGEVGTSGANIVASNYNDNTTDLKKAVIAAAVGMTGSVEFDTAFHASNSGSLAEKSGYSATDLHAGIRELQTYVGDASTLSTSGDTVTTHVETAGGSAHTGNSTTTLTLASPATFAQVDVGYQVQINVNGDSYQNGDESQIPAGTKVVRRISSTEFELNNAVTVDTAGGVTRNLAFSKTADYGFQNDVITDALIELRNALVGGTADLTDKINTLDDSDGAGTDFSSTNVVDAIRELQDDLGQRTLITGSPFHSDINGTYNTTNIVTVLNAITAAIGSHDIGDAVNTGNETLTNAIAQLRTDIGDAGSSGATLTTTATDLTTAINELDFEIGPISNAKLGTAANRSKTYASGGANGATTVTLNNVAGLIEGMNVSGTNIPAGTKISSISSNTITLTQAVNGAAGVSGTLSFTTEDIQSSILANTANIGSTEDLDDAVGYTTQQVVLAIKEIQGLIGDIQDNNEAPILNSVNTRITRNTNAEVTTGATIAVADTTGITVGMKVKNTASGRTGSIAAGTLVNAVNVGVSIGVDTAVVSTINSGDTLQFDSPTVVNAVRSIDARIGQQVTPANMGTTATTLVTAIKETTDEIGDVTANNLGTTSSTITTAIKEIVDGTGQADVQVGAEATGGATITRNAANGGFLKKVKAGYGADAQTIVSNLNFDAAGPTDVLHKTTMKFGANTVLDVSLATLITEAADANFDTTARKIVFGSTVNDGQGIEIDRSNEVVGTGNRTITGAVGNLGINPSILWVDGEVTARDPSAATATATTGGSNTASGTTTITVVSTGNLEAGMVVTSDVAGALVPGTFIANIINSTSFGISQATTAIIPASTILNFDIHSRNDLGWKVKGFKPTSTPDAADSFYQAPNVDFYNAGRLFGKGTSGIDSTQNGVTVTWDPVTQHFDTSLQTIPGLSAGTTGNTTTVPVITVDTFGRITAVTTANVADALGQFTLEGDSGSQTIGVNETVKILGTSNEITTALTESGGINTVTVGLPNDVTIGNDLTVTDRLIVQGTSDDPSTFDGDVQIDGDLNVQGSISVGEQSLSFTTTSATVSSKQIILNALADTAQADVASDTGQANVPAASFVAHRGFKSTILSGGLSILTKGLRYKIKSSGADNAITANEQAAIKAVSGATDDHVHNEVITATTTGNFVLGNYSNITFREQQTEAKIAWNEGTDQWELYRGTDETQGAIVTQTDTFKGALSANAQVTPFNSSATEDYNLLHFPVSAPSDREKLYQNNSLTFNPGRKDLKLNGRMAIGGTGVPDGSTFFNPLAQLHIKTNINSEDATLILESDHDNDNELSNPVLQLIQDGRRIRSAIQMTGNGNDGATGAKRNALLFSTSAENVSGNAYMHFATGGVITTTDGATDITLDSTADWKGWNEVYLIDQNGGEGALQYGFNPTMDASGRANQKLSFIDANDQVSLGANTFYASNASEGLFIDTNGDQQNDTDIRINQAGTDGGAYMKIQSFREDLTWHGRSLTFSGDVGPAADADNMHSSYEVFAFIKYVIRSGNGPIYGYRLGAIEQVDIRNLSGTSFSLSLNIPNNFELAATEIAIPQIGFTVNGVNAVANTQRATGDLDVTNLAATVSEVLTGGADDAAAGNPLITTKPQVRMTITSDTGHVGIATTEPGAKLDVHGNFRVEGDQNSSFPITTGDGAEDDDLLHTAVFASNNLSQANSLSTTLNKQLKQAVFVSRPAYSGALSYLDITDVRTISNNNTLAGSAKRIQSRTSTNKNEQGDRKGFISFPGNSNLVEIGGIHTNVDKVGVSTNSGGPTQIFHNTANATPSSKKLETTTGGIAVTGHLTSTTAKIGGLKIADTVSDNHATYPAYNNYIAFKGTSGDQYGNYNHTYIGERIYGADSAGDGDTRPDGEKSELLFMKLNDTETTGGGSDRIRHFASNHVFDISTSTAVGAADGDLEAALNATNRTSFTAMTIRQSGNVGIGTVTPWSPLHIMAPNTLGNSFTGTTKGQGLTISQSEYTAENHISLIEGAYVGSGSNNPNYRIGVKFTGAEGSFLKFGTSTNYASGITNTAMVIDHRGRVGIGVDEHVPAAGDVPANNNGVLAKLHVNGTGQFEGKLTITDGIDTTGDIQVGQYGNQQIRVRDIQAGGPSTGGNNSAALRLNAGESIDYAPTNQDGKLVYINAEGGLQVNSHPSNWIANADAGTTGGWAGKNGTVSINKADGSSEFNQIKHTGLTMTSGTDIDQLYTLNFTPPTNNEWTDIGINGDDLATGTYIVQMHIYEGAGGQYDEFYSGTMSWFGASVNDDNTDEIFLHNAGHASQASSGELNANWFLRTKRLLHTENPSGNGYLKLQVRSSYTPPADNANRTYTIKLRRMI